MFEEKINLFKSVASVIDDLDTSKIDSGFLSLLEDVKLSIKDVQLEYARYIISVPMVAKKRLETVIALIDECYKLYNTFMKLI